MYLPDKSDEERGCDGCLTVIRTGGSISAFRDLNVSSVTKDLLHTDIPYIVLDADRDWPADMKLSFHAISEVTVP